MTATLAQIWRYPIKGIGAEALEGANLAPDLPVPGDRAWALREAGAETGVGPDPEAGPRWEPCRNFLRGAKGPSLMAIRAETIGAQIRLTHPDRPALEIDPARDGAALIDWITPIYPKDRPAPAALVAAPKEGMSDANFPSVSILNLASLRALSQRIGQALDPRRFRGNLWVEGWAPWEEFDLVGRQVRIGGTKIDIIEPITRCRAIEANPDTGRRDANPLRMLKVGWGHEDFGVYGRVAAGGAIALGDPVVSA